MHIPLVGLNHKTAPLEVRERVSFTKEQLPQALSLLRERVGQGATPSTCNRTEVYTAVEDPTKGAEQVRDFVSEFHGLAAEDLPPYLYHHTNAEAVHHLFRVAGGLDSMILGESQILGQVRDALTAASEAHSIEVALVGLFHAAVRAGRFHAAVRAGRRVREETSVGRNALSISYAGVRLAQPEHREVMEALTRSIVKKLLHNPTTFLKERADKRQLQAVRDLFRLWHDS